MNLTKFRESSSNPKKVDDWESICSEVWSNPGNYFTLRFSFNEFLSFNEFSKGHFKQNSNNNSTLVYTDHVFIFIRQIDHTFVLSGMNIEFT